MEDAMSELDAHALLPLGAEVAFSDIGEESGAQAVQQAKRALTATIVVVGPHDRLVEAADAVEHLTDIGVRAILISYGTNPAPTVRLLDHAVTLEGLRPDYLNNAVAALRLSSLPTVVWWRGGAPEMLDGLAELADRLVLDADEPPEVWARTHIITGRTGISDLRWTRLTRWRALMAQFFDLPEGRRAAASFNRLRIRGADTHAARLYAGWLASSLGWTPSQVAIELQGDAGAAPLEEIDFGGGKQGVMMRLMPGTDCIEATARVDGRAPASRVVSLGNQHLAALIGEELRIRSRDLAFERAVAAAQGVV
jgi:hypothetical protein